MARKRKPTFGEFLRMIYNMDYGDYLLLNQGQQTAIDIDYQDRYEKIIFERSK